MKFKWDDEKAVDVFLDPLAAEAADEAHSDDAAAEIG
jgi:hypothetical protein